MPKSCRSVSYSLYACITYACMHVCMYVMHVYMHACTYYASKHMYVCMYVKNVFSTRDLQEEIVMHAHASIPTSRLACMHVDTHIHTSRLSWM